MNRPDKIKDETLRSQVADAHSQLRGDPSAAVRTLADAFVGLLARHPELLDLTTTVRGRSFPLVARWPALGANLVLDPEGGKPPRVEMVRDRFVLSEALTYYEFLVDLAVDQEL
jgi:hypothetical protein